MEEVDLASVLLAIFYWQVKVLETQNFSHGVKMRNSIYNQASTAKRHQKDFVGDLVELWEKENE